MTKKQVAELVKLCDYPKLQRLWKPKMGDEFYDVDYPGILFVDNFFSKKYPVKPIWLPRIEDCIRLMGGKLWNLTDVRTDGYFVCGVQDSYNTKDKSPRLACLKALRSVLKGDKWKEKR